MPETIVLTAFDPITNRQISNACWNGRHDEPGDEQWCKVEECKCMCHDLPQAEQAGTEAVAL